MSRRVVARAQVEGERRQRMKSRIREILAAEAAASSIRGESQRALVITASIVSRKFIRVHKQTKTTRYLEGISGTPRTFDSAQGGIASRLRHRRTPPGTPGLRWIIRAFNAFALPRAPHWHQCGAGAQVREAPAHAVVLARRSVPRADTSIKALLGRAERARYKANVNTSRPRRGPPPCPSADSSPSGPRPVRALPSVTEAIQHAAADLILAPGSEADSTTGQESRPAERYPRTGFALCRDPGRFEGLRLTGYPLAPSAPGADTSSPFSPRKLIRLPIESPILPLLSPLARIPSSAVRHSHLAAGSCDRSRVIVRFRFSRPFLERGGGIARVRASGVEILREERDDVSSVSLKHAIAAPRVARLPLRVKFSGRVSELFNRQISRDPACLGPENHSRPPTIRCRYQLRVNSGHLYARAPYNLPRGLVPGRST